MKHHIFEDKKPLPKGVEVSSKKEGEPSYCIHCASPDIHCQEYVGGWDIYCRTCKKNFLIEEAK